MDRNESNAAGGEMQAHGVSLEKHKEALLTLLREFDRVCRQLNIPYTLFAGSMLGAVRHKGFIPWDDDLDVLMMREDYDRFLREADRVLDREKFFLQKEFSDHWPMFFSKLRINNTTCLETYHPKDPLTHQGVYIDLFPCDNAMRRAWGRRLQFYASKVVIAKSLTQRGYETYSFKKKMFMTLCRLLPMRPFLRLVKGGAPDGRLVHTFLGGATSYSKNVHPRACFDEKVMLPFEDGAFPVASRHYEILTTLYGDYMRIPPPEERRIKRHAVLVDLERPYDAYREYHLSMSFDVVTKSIR